MKRHSYFVFPTLISILILIGIGCASSSQEARVLNYFGSWEQVRKGMQEHLAKNPQDAEAWYFLGVANRNLSDNENAVRAFDKCASLDPSRSDAINSQLALIPSFVTPKTEEFRKWFERALDDSNYVEAEHIKQDWLDYLQSIQPQFLSRKEQRYLKSLRGIVGLANPILVPLRTKLLVAIQDDRYDDALKIQQLILNRENQLLASSARDEEKPAADTSRYDARRGNEQIRIEHQNVPRYGATDIGEQLNILLSRRLSQKERAGLKLIDIFLGR